MSDFIKKYEADLARHLRFDSELVARLESYKETILAVKENRGRMIFIGNGGSAAISSHIAVDFSKNAGIEAINFNESSLITCLSNDYGHQYWMEKALQIYGKENDLIVLISSSGNSENIINAGKWALRNNLKLITFSGMNVDNPLKKMNSNGINFWVDSYSYNHIELIHLAYNLLTIDNIIGHSVYSSNR